MTEKGRTTPQGALGNLGKEVTKENSYQTAIKKLHAFVNLDTDEVSNIEDLARVLSGIPESLVKIAQTIKRRVLAREETFHGGAFQNFSYFGKDEFVPQSIDVPIEGGLSLSLSWDNKEIIIDKSFTRKSFSVDSEDSEIYLVYLPRRITQNGDPRVELVEAKARDDNTTEVVFFSPAEDLNRNSQQEYVSILKEGIKDLLTVLPRK